MMKTNDETLSKVMKELSDKGFKEQFQIKENEIIALTNKTTFKPEQLTILHSFRFDGMTNPSDESTLYAIESSDGTKGTLVVSGNVHSNQDIIKRIPSS